MTAKNMDVTRVNLFHKICWDIQKTDPAHDGFHMLMTAHDGCLTASYMSCVEQIPSQLDHEIEAFS
jgi:hypothetical protein